MTTVEPENRSPPLFLKEKRRAEQGVRAERFQIIYMEEESYGT